MMVLGVLMSALCLGEAEAQDFNIEEKCANDFRVAMEYWRSRQIPDAHELFTTVVEACPANVEAYFYKGRCESDMKQYNEAIRTFKGGLDVEEGHVGIRENYAFALLQDNQTEAGIGVYRALIAEFPEKVDYWVRMGYAANEATKSLKEQVAAAEGSAADELRAKRRKLTADAMMASMQAVELRADSLSLWKTLDYHLALHKAVVPSLQSGEKIRINEPDNLRVRSRIGAIYKNAKRFERAIPVYEEIYEKLYPTDGATAVELTKRRAQDLWQYATVLKGLKQYDRATEVFEKVLASEWYANNAGAWTNQAFMYKDAKEYDDAIRCASKALEIDSANCSAMCARGKGYEGKALDAERAANFASASTFIGKARADFGLATSTCPSGTWNKYAAGEMDRMDKHDVRLKQRAAQ
jgi:tetratricopeptide (TPR) repeat protein